MTMEWRREEFTISTDKERLDRAAIHEFLRGSYWAKGIPREVVDRSIEHSLCFGLYDGNRLVGFARVISDLATFGYLSDVFVLESHRGRGLATWFIQIIMAHPDLQGLRRWMLATADAHGLYRKIGFTEPSRPERLMEKLLADPYGAGRG
jgi:GNAT superfamily N-acetyltransferase